MGRATATTEKKPGRFRAVLAAMMGMLAGAPRRYEWRRTRNHHRGVWHLCEEGVDTPVCNPPVELSLWPAGRWSHTRHHCPRCVDFARAYGVPDNVELAHALTPDA